MIISISLSYFQTPYRVPLPFYHHLQIAQTLPKIFLLLLKERAIVTHWDSRLASLSIFAWFTLHDTKQWGSKNKNLLFRK